MYKWIAWSSYAGAYVATAIVLLGAIAIVCWAVGRGASYILQPHLLLCYVVGSMMTPAFKAAQGWRNRRKETA